MTRIGRAVTVVVFGTAWALAQAFVDAFTVPFQQRSESVRNGSTLSMSSALIIQNKGGGHGELGYQLAKKLKEHPKITSVTILQDDDCDASKEPFRSYPYDLPDVPIVWAPFADECITIDTYANILYGQKFDYVWDNASKKPEGFSKIICDCAKRWNVKLFTYVSSAGMYQPNNNNQFPMPETTPVKESAGQNQFDRYAAGQGLPLVSFRPQYIYGEKANKHDYIDYYFDRIVRGLPIPIPGDGTQLVSLTNSEDVAALLAAPLDNEDAAIEQRFFNCGTDELHSYDEVAYLCAEAAGVPADQVKIEHFDASRGKGAFPFRPTNFYVTPDTAKTVLGYPGATHKLKDDLKWYFEQYKERGGMTKELSLEKDQEVLV